MDKFRHIDTWIFDMDNTLYNAEKHIFPQMATRMNSFISDLLSVPPEEAALLRKKYWEKYGTSMRGLMVEHGVDPNRFLDKIHEIDISEVDPCTITQEYLSHLPGRKIVYTNAPRHFATRMIKHLGLTHHFEDMFTIEDAGFIPKPDASGYHTMINKFQVNPKTSCMLEDMAVNLKPAAELGMTTIWLHGEHQSPDDADHPHIHHKAVKMPDWLKSTIKKG